MHNYIPMIPQPRWQDVLDILIVAYVIYRIAMLIRGTRTMQMVLGLVIVGGAFVASQVLGLFTLNWLLNNFLGSLFVILVVIFQADIRRALTRVGAQSFLGRNAATATPAEEIATAAAWCSARRVGALIVIEQDDGLGEFVESGRIIDGKVSPELLETIFMNGSPLHDGAVIINGDRVLAAACLLPLSQNPNVSLSLGTRHRAAIGLSEDSDAVVLVVSEESGTISLARGGVLQSRTGTGRGFVHLEEAAGLGARVRAAGLRTMKLHDFKNLSAANLSRRLRGSNIGLRVLALVLAVGLWIFVNAGERGSVESLTVPISYASLPQGMVIVNSPPTQVKIEVTGPRTLALVAGSRAAHAQDRYAQCCGRDRSEFKIYPSMFNVGRNTAVTSISPDSLSLDIDRLVTRDVPVHLAVEDRVAPGYTISSVDIAPPNVTVVGPSRYVAPLTSVNTEPFDLKGLTSDTKRSVDIVPPDPSLGLSTGHVDARVNVTRGDYRPRVSLGGRGQGQRLQVPRRAEAGYS